MIGKGLHSARSQFKLISGLTLLFLITVVPSTNAYAVTINVTSTADTLSDDGKCTLREAVIAANENFPSGVLYGECPAGAIGLDTISLTIPGIYQIALPGDREDLARTGDLDLLEDVTIEGGGAETYIVHAGFLDRVFHVEERTASVTIRNITVTGGQLASGGEGAGLHNRGSLLLEDVSIFGNQIAGCCGDGAGIYHQGELLQVTRAEIRNNITSSGGAAYGGGVYLRGNGTAVFADCLFQENTANYGGGIGISVAQDTIIIIDSRFINNHAATAGGGIRSLTDQLTISGSTFSGNTSEEYGGGMWSRDAYISNSTFYRNSAIEGGGLYADSSFSDLILQHVTFDEAYDNTSTAIFNEASLMISNSIIAGRCDGVFLTSWGGNVEVLGSTCGLLDPTDFISVSLQSINLGQLKDNGGKTPTQLPGAGSIALENGDSGQCLLDDQRNVSRPQDFDNSGGAQCDIGAVELMACGLGAKLTLSNDTIAGPQTFEACESIEAGTNFIIDSPAVVSMKASGFVSLNAGFGVMPGASLGVSTKWAFWESN